MSEDEVCEVWCLIDEPSSVDRQQRPFTIDASLKWNVNQLKKAIRGEKRDLHPFCTSDIVLLKLKALPIDPDPTLAQRLPNPITDFSVELDRSTLNVSAIFPGGLVKDHLHIVVKVPVTAEPHPIGVIAVERSASRPRHLGGHIIPREELVNLLHQRLSDYRIIHIRGTPACGKTTLCNLLHIHLKRQNAVVYTIPGWRKDKFYEVKLKELCGDFHPTRPTYLLFDEGQHTYSDTDMWNFFFKALRLMGNVYVALFCCYGSTSSRILSEAPEVFDEPQHLLDRYPHPLKLADDVKREILKWSAGHIGGIEYLLDSIRRKNSDSMRAGNLYTPAKFHDDHSPSEIGRGFRFASGGRGLPDPDELQRDPSMTAMFRRLIRDVEKAHKRGYLYATLLSGSQKGFVLPTALHTVGLSWILVYEVDLPSDLTMLVWEVVGRFKYSQLALPIRRAGPETTPDSPPEAQYQDEFYRALYDFTKGGVLVSPEFASASGASVAGRIDFYLASKKWGIEITWDGKKLQEHSDRFGALGAHGRWLASGEMSDYILLDCRSTRPIKPYSWIPNLFHAVFDQATQSVTVYNNRCEKIITRALLETQTTWKLPDDNFRMA